MGYKNSGVVTVGRFHATAPTVNAVPTSFSVSVKGHKLTKKDLGGKSDPYLVVKSGSRVIHKTDVIKQDIEPVWPSFTLDVAQCGGMDADITWEVYDWDKHTKDDLIGKTGFTLRRLSLFEKNPVIRLVDDKIKKLSWL
jgi:Ca2+-dependent lipid-binding protein